MSVHQDSHTRTTQPNQSPRPSGQRQQPQQLAPTAPVLPPLHGRASTFSSSGTACVLRFVSHLVAAAQRPWPASSCPPVAAAMTVTAASRAVPPSPWSTFCAGTRELQRQQRRSRQVRQSSNEENSMLGLLQRRREQRCLPSTLQPTRHQPRPVPRKPPAVPLLPQRLPRQPSSSGWTSAWPRWPPRFQSTGALQGWAKANARELMQ